VGEGRIPTDLGMPDYTVKVPDEFLYDGDLIDYVYPDIHLGRDMQDTATKAILSPKNVDVDFINEKAMQKFPGPVMCLESADSIFDVDDDTINATTVQYPIEFLNGLEMSGMPPHRLMLKLGVPIILLRNLDSDHGLCNGTRLKVLAMSRNLFKVKILNGSHSGSEAFIPRIDLIPTNEILPFKLRRRQFPVRLAFAMTINKSQGQSLQHVGIYLSAPVFAHGQLYVAYSRSGNPDKAKIKLKPQSGVQGPFAGKEGSYTKNVVYKSVDPSLFPEQ
jgi:ATP-dependent DNA helicase PIF1